MYFILKTKDTLTLKVVPAQVQSKNHWSASNHWSTTKNLELWHRALKE
jgi:hypothetical protein